MTELLHTHTKRHSVHSISPTWDDTMQYVYQMQSVWPERHGELVMEEQHIICGHGVQTPPQPSAEETEKHTAEQRAHKAPGNITTATSQHNKSV